MLNRFSSRRSPLDRSFLAERLRHAQGYDRIAGYFSSSLLELVGEELESVQGKIRVVCNSDLHPLDVRTAQAAQSGLWRGWTASRPEELLDGAGQEPARQRFRRLYHFLTSGKLEVRVLPDTAFGLIHGKAGVITLADGRRTSFLGSANESKSAWRMNYELIWEDDAAESVAWVQAEFDALWSSPYQVPLAQAVIEDFDRLARRRLIHSMGEWRGEGDESPPNPAPALIESPVYRREVGLWPHQKYFVKTVFDAHHGPQAKARFVLADQVGLGKTLQLAMAAQLIALTGSRPILVICPKTLTWQWQGEMRDLLDMPSAVWDGRRWVDEQEVEYPALGARGIRKCPRRVGIVSSGLLSRGSEAAEQLRNLEYDCVILDEAHRARRRNLGPNRDSESAEPNNLLAFMHDLAPRTRSLLLATATPVQLRPVEAWDLLDILSRGDDSVLGNAYSYWRMADRALGLVMERDPLPDDEVEVWEWLRNPLPPKEEGRDFEILRRSLGVDDGVALVAGNDFQRLGAPDRRRLRGQLILAHNPFIRRIVRRTRQHLENQRDPVSGEPLLKPIAVDLLGENDNEAIRLPLYLQDAYQLAENFCDLLGERMRSAGFLRTLLLRRVGSSIHAGLQTARRMLGDWETALESDEEDDPNEESAGREDRESLSRSLTDAERALLARFVHALESSRDQDPKYAVVLDCLRRWGWLEMGCIIFSQYRDSILWLADQLTAAFPQEAIAIYSGPSTSGLMRNGEWTSQSRESLKQMVQRGELRLMLGTDAASEGLNLQRLARLINLDLPWNPTRLEQRKGRIQRIGQIHDRVQVYNMRYKDSVEDRVHQLLSGRLQDIFHLFGQIPDVLEDVWVAVAQGDQERATRIIDALPSQHPFDLRYAAVERVDWESCADVLDAREKRQALKQGWG